MLREIRKKKNITIKELALKLKLTRNAITQYETGKRTPSLQTMQKLADALEVDLQTIFECFVKSEGKNEDN